MELRFENVTKYYGKQCVLNNFCASLTEGVYGLLGPNGSGKTTLINILSGILQAEQGNIYLDNINVRDMGARYLDKIGYLPQDPIFYKNFRINEFLEYMCTLKGVPKKQVKERIKEVLGLVNLADVSEKKIGTLSGGMKQRVGIAQSIINRPNILILDEPTAGLDPVERIRFRNIISKLAKDKIVLLATHIVSDVEYIAKHVLFLKKGNLVMQDTPQMLCENLKEMVWQALTSEEEMDYLIEKYSIGNIRRVEEGFILRIISKEKPNDYLSAVEPCLEDVFFYIFEK